MILVVAYSGTRMVLQVTAALMLTRSLRDSETSIDFIQQNSGEW